MFIYHIKDSFIILELCLLTAKISPIPNKIYMYHNHMTILALYCHPPKTRVIVWIWSCKKKKKLSIRLELPGNHQGH